MHMQRDSKMVWTHDGTPAGDADSPLELNMELHRHTLRTYLPSLVQLSAEIHGWNCHACKDNKLCSASEYSWDTLCRETAIRLY